MTIEQIIKDLSNSEISRDEAINRLKLLKTYSNEEIKKAGEIGEISSIDTNHLIKQLPEARRELQNGWSCRTCANMHVTFLDSDYCTEISFVKMAEGKDCKGKKYLKNDK